MHQERIKLKSRLPDEADVVNAFLVLAFNLSNKFDSFGDDVYFCQPDIVFDEGSTVDMGAVFRQ